MWTLTPALRKNCRWAAMNSGASPTFGVSATVMSAFTAGGAGVDDPPRKPHPATTIRPATRAVALASTRTGRPALRGSAAWTPLGTSLTETPWPIKRTVTDSSEHAVAPESTLPTGGRRANVRYISFFLVMRELLPVGRLAVRVSP